MSQKPHVMILVVVGKTLGRNLTRFLSCRSLTLSLTVPCQSPLCSRFRGTFSVLHL